MTDKMLGSMTPAILQLARALYDVKATSLEGSVSVRGLYESDESVIRRPLLKS